MDVLFVWTQLLSTEYNSMKYNRRKKNKYFKFTKEAETSVTSYICTEKKVDGSV